MKWIKWAVNADVVSLGQPALAEPGCDAWNTWDFFEDADDELVRKCFAVGADPGARDKEGRILADSGYAEAIAALLAARAEQGGPDPDAQGLGGHFR